MSKILNTISTDKRKAYRRAILMAVALLAILALLALGAYHVIRYADPQLYYQLQYYRHRNAYLEATDYVQYAQLTYADNEYPLNVDTGVYSLMLPLGYHREKVSSQYSYTYTSGKNSYSIGFAPISAEVVYSKLKAYGSLQNMRADFSNEDEYAKYLNNCYIEYTGDEIPNNLYELRRLFSEYTPHSFSKDDERQRQVVAGILTDKAEILSCDELMFFDNGSAYGYIELEYHDESPYYVARIVVFNSAKKGTAFANYEYCLITYSTDGGRFDELYKTVNSISYQNKD